MTAATDDHLRRLPKVELHCHVEGSARAATIADLARKHGVELLRDNGRIVNIASIAGLFPFHGQANYAAAKAGVIALTKVLAKEFARRGITANAIAPGVIQTTMIGDIKAEVLDGYIKQIPIGRLGKPEDVANAVLFFASEESGYVTGQVLPVTGGWF